VDMALIQTETHYRYTGSEVQVLRRIRDALIMRRRSVIDTEVISTICALYYQLSDFLLL